MTTPCSEELLESALAGDLPPEREQLLHRHLEECQACTTSLERMAGGADLWREAAVMFAGDEVDDALSARDEWSNIDFTVEHLEPADEPGVLGRLGGYDVLEIIGRGGMGVVLKGFDPELKRCVAIKVLSPHLALSSLARKRFAREAQAAAAVVHANVLAIHQVQPAGRLPFLVMPLVAGESLAQRLTAQGRLELKEVLRIGMQAAAGLSAAHEQGLVHRDVKPANILLEKGVERAVLTDFGLARAADDVSMTRWGIIAGTPQYMSPEQARGEPVDGRSDLFSLGCVLYEMATGVSPFRADSTLATLRRLIDDPPPAMASKDPELPPWFIGIVGRLLEKEPSKRFGSAKEVSELLEGCLAHLQQPATVPLPAGLTTPATRRASKRPGTLFKGFIAMIATLGIVFLGMVAMQATTPPDISGNWQGEDWGQVTLTQTAPGEYTGTYTDTVAKKKGPGKIDLKWSRIEHRFSGTWREGEDDRFGELSIRLVDKVIRGALTTSAKSKINPATPRLADLVWTRKATMAALQEGVPSLQVLKAAYEAAKAKAINETGIRYAVAAAKVARADYESNKKTGDRNPGSLSKDRLIELSLKCTETELAVELAKLNKRLAGEDLAIAEAELDFAQVRQASPSVREMADARAKHIVAIAEAKYRAARLKAENDINLRYAHAAVAASDEIYESTAKALTSESPTVRKEKLDPLRLRCDEEEAEVEKAEHEQREATAAARVAEAELEAARQKASALQSAFGKEKVLRSDPNGDTSAHPRAIQFDGNHYAKVDPPPKFTSGDFTISLWFNPVRAADWANLFMRGFGWRDQRGDIGLQFNRDSGNLGFAAYSAGESAVPSGWIFGWGALEPRLRSPVHYGQWNHAVVTRRGDTYTMWMNGARAASEKSSADISDADNTNPFIVGGMMYEQGLGTMYQGALDDFRIFRRCLSEKEIADLFTANGDESYLQGEGRMKIGPLCEASATKPADDAIIPTGMRVIVVRPDQYESEAGPIVPKALVDVQLLVRTARPGDGGAAETKVITILRDIRVFAVDGKTTVAAEHNDTKASSSRPSVTLLLTPSQVETIADAASAGTLRLVARNANSPGNLPPPIPLAELPLPQRIVRLEELVGQAEASYSKGLARLNDVCGPRDELLNAQLEAAKSKAERIGRWEELLKRNHELERSAEARLKLAPDEGAKADFLRAGAERRKAELGLEEEKLPASAPESGDKPSDGSHKSSVPTIQQIAAAWKARQDRLRSVRMQWTETELIPKGFRPRLNILNRGKQSRTQEDILPPTDTAIECTRCDLISGNMLRMNRDGPYWHWERAMNWDTNVATFDGEVAKMFFDEKSTGEMHGFIEREAHNPNYDSRSFLPIALAFRPCEPDMGGRNPTDFRVLPDTQTIDGRTCIVITAGPRGRFGETLLLDPQRDFLPLRVQERGPNDRTLEIAYQKDHVHGWIPLEWTYIDIGGTSQRLFGWLTGKVTAYTINADIPRSEFQFEFPVGTYVTDLRAGESKDMERYIVREGGKKRIITQDEIRREMGANYKELLRTESGKAGLDRDSTPKEKSDNGPRHQADPSKAQKATAPATKPPFEARLPSGVTAELYGVAENPSKDRPWWRPDGSPLDKRPYETLEGMWPAEFGKNRREFAIILKNLSAGPTSLHLYHDGDSRPNSMPAIDMKPTCLLNVEGEPDSKYPRVFRAVKRELHVLVGSWPAKTKTATILIGVGSGLWRTVGDSAQPALGETSVPAVLFSKPEEKDGNLSVTVTHGICGDPPRVVAVDAQGREHLAKEWKGGVAGQNFAVTATFTKLSAKQVTAFRLQTQIFERVEFRNVSLHPGEKTHVQVVQPLPSAPVPPEIEWQTIEPR